MSWAVSAVGTPQAVSAKIIADLSTSKCAEPEETIKTTIMEALGIALGAFPADVAVSVSASGSQYTPDSSKPDCVLNTLKVTVEPLYGFVK
jgi:hypothetical protein